MTTGVRTIVYHPPVAASFGERFEATTTNRQVEIGFGSKRFHFTMRSSRFHRSARPVGRARGGSVVWQAMAYVGCASLALGLVFVSGGVLRAAPAADRYAVVMAIGAKATPGAQRQKSKARRVVRARPATPFAPVTNDAEDWSVAPATDMDEGSGLARPDPDVATLPTVNGERAVAVYGPSRRVGGKLCRDVNVFVRDTDGKVSASPTTRCETAR